MTQDVDDLLIGDFRKLSENDKLFAESDDWWMNACLDWYSDPTELYVTGYKEAADSLVQIISDRKGSADSLIFPIVFLYRQYLELRIKDILKEGNKLLGVEYKQKAEHKLSKLWPKARNIIVELWPEEDDEPLKAIDSLISQFSEVDPNSTSFRYPKNFKGDNSVKSDLPRINLRNLAEVIESMSMLLDGVAGAISEYQSNLNDLQSGT